MGSKILRETILIFSGEEKKEIKERGGKNISTPIDKVS